MVIPNSLNSSATSTLQQSMSKKLGQTVRCLVINIRLVFDQLILS